MGPSRSCWNGTTSALQPKEITSKGNSVLSIKVLIGKKSGNLSYAPRTPHTPMTSACLLQLSSQLVEVKKEIRKYEVVARVKINPEKSVGLRLDSCKSCALPSPYNWTNRSCKMLSVWFGPNLQLERNWSEAVEKIVAATDQWPRRGRSFKCRDEVGGSHIYPLVLYRLSAIHPTSYYPNQSVKGSVPVYLGQTSTYGTSADVSPSAVRRLPRSTKRENVQLHFMS